MKGPRKFLGAVAPIEAPLCKSRMKPSKDPYAAQELRVAHPSSLLWNSLSDDTKTSQSLAIF